MIFEVVYIYNYDSVVIDVIFNKPLKIISKIIL